MEAIRIPINIMVVTKQVKTRSFLEVTRNEIHA